ncbi:EAL domain-containing protein [Roseibium algae]|uniref:EAL domain-containing protein n=1 Tax=Roseibium algae TaxID=3123038 RepID=A0ABU8TLP6_9HYPH
MLQSSGKKLPTVYELLLDVLPEPAAFFDAEARCIAFNNMFGSYLRGFSNHTEGAILSCLLTPDSTQRCQRAVGTAAAGSIVEVQGVLACLNGAVLCSSATCTPVFLGIDAEVGVQPLVLMQFHREVDCRLDGNSTANDPTFSATADVFLNDLELHACPVYDLAKLQPVGADIILSLRGEYALVPCSSDKLIASAKRNGSVVQLDSWTLDQVLDFAWSHTRRSWLSVNVSAEAIVDSRLRDLLQFRLDADPLLAERLCLQISERDYLANPEDARRFIQLASELGCQTAIDDFSGNELMLKRLAKNRVDWLTLEPALTNALNEGAGRKRSLGSAVLAGKKCGARIIAKNVRSEICLNRLRDHNVDAAHGPYFGEAKPWPWNVAELVNRPL